MSSMQHRGMAVFIAVACAAVMVAQGQPVYSRGADWPETMRASLKAYRAWHTEQDYALGPWWATAPMAADGFAQTHVAVDAVHGEGEAGWTARPEYADGEGHNLPAAEGASTYLYRMIQANDATLLRAELGSDDGIQVWLNGEECWVNDVPRVLDGGRDAVSLPLHAGDNHLLLKIYNRSGGHGFFFSVGAEAANPLWGQIAEDFPEQAAWLARDMPGNVSDAWFSEVETPEVETRILSAALKDVPSISVIHQAFVALRQEGAPRDDVRWLSLYERACRARELATTFGSDRMTAIRRAVEDLATSFPDRYDGTRFLGELSACEQQLADLRAASNAGTPPTLADMRDLGTRLDELLLANPLLDFDRLLLVKRNANKLGLPQNWQGNCSVGGFGYDNEIETLSPVRPGGKLTRLFRPERDAFVGDMDLHFDGDRMLVSMPGSHERWQIWELPVNGAAPRQVTPGAYSDVDNYDACYLPDGRIIFASTRCFQGVPCVGGADQVANLFQMEADGTKVRQLCFDQDHNWCPTVMNNGRVMFTRWEYSDTPHYFSRLLFHMNPDGTNQVAYYGSNSYWPNSLFYARPIPEHPTQFIGIVSGHHGVPRMGELILFDVAKGRFEADGVVQRIPGFGEKVEPTIADQLVEDSWPKFLHPYPLNDRYFLVSCKRNAQASWGIYLADIFDNLTLLKEVPGYALFEPVPLRPTPKPPVIPDKVRLDRDTATVYITNLYEGEGLRGVPPGTVKRLRVMEFHYAYNRTGGHENIGMEGPWDVRRILGTAPVYEDGSALFVVPSNMPIAIQPLDSEGKAVQTMRSWFTAMPGEVVSCTGCHESQNSAPSLGVTIASRQEPDPLTPWYGPARGFSFAREVQPVLTQHCVGCHDGAPREDGDSLPDFTERTERGWGGFTPSYLALHPYVRRPGPESDYHLLKPMEYHPDTSPLIQMLQKGHGGVRLDAEGWDRLVTWIDLNAPDHGTWQEQCTIPDQIHQRRMAMRAAYAGRPEDPEYIPAYVPPSVGMVSKPPSVSPASRAETSLAGWPLTTYQAFDLQKSANDLTRKTVDLGEGVTMDLVLVPAGAFVMGDATGPDDARPETPVVLGEPFWMSATEVTLAQFRRFHPDHDQGYIDQQNKDHTRPGYAIDEPEMPAVRVTWEEAATYCAQLADVTGLAFDLPSEAQWEWACRGGTDTAMNFAAGVEEDFAAHANLADASLSDMAVAGIDPQPIPQPNLFQAFLPKRADVDDGHMLMAPVAQYEPNIWGLFDMHGNAAEWTRSAYLPYPYADDDGRNAPGPLEKRVVRGGSWRDLPQWSSSSYRLAYAPWQPVYNVGFRVVCPVSRKVNLTDARL